MATVRAMVHTAYGSPEQALELRRVEPPRPDGHQVLVDVHASTVSEALRRSIQGRPYRSRFGTGLRRPSPRIPGRDFAGRVLAVGAAVTTVRPGDEVFGWCEGAFAEQAVVRVDQLARRPANLSAEQAAVVPSAGATALRAVRDAGRVGPGEDVLVVGASGGVGTFAVQIARALGAEVTGVCSTANCGLVRSVGADRTIDYTLEDPAAVSARFDVIVDLVGDRAAEVRRALRPGGTLVRVGTVGRTRADALEDLCDLVEAGRLVPIVSAHYPLAEVPSALGHFAPGHARGKIAITV